MIMMALDDNWLIWKVHNNNEIIVRFNTTVATLQAENKALQSKNAAFEAKQQSHTVKQDKMIATLQCK